ncbi:IS110 family transposase [Bradyrhizobium elkanii]|uniref:IS110 family transposase n=1 Tax=Bradyrhizobium elkanii TaxID=29448 RepID=UPI003BAB86D3
MKLNGDANKTTNKVLNAIFVSVELSRKTWLVTSLVPGTGEKLSRHTVMGGDIAGLLERLARLKQKALDRTDQSYPIIVIQEAGLDGFWVHRVLQAQGHESHIVDAASIAVSRRRRRIKKDRLDGETLIRALLAFERGEPRVCSMLRVPSPDDEDRRRITRERMVLMQERIQHSNRIKGLLFSQGVTDYDPLRRGRRERFEAVRTGDGRDLPQHMKRQFDRDQGIGKSGNTRLRSTLLEMAWLWLRHQPGSALSRWFNERVAQNGGRFKKVMITALARKLIVALWKYVSAGVVIEGAIVRP